MVTPKSPMAFICSTMASGYSSACSSSDATGTTSRSTKRRTAPISSSRTSGSVPVVCVIARHAIPFESDQVVGEGDLDHPHDAVDDGREQPVDERLQHVRVLGPHLETVHHLVLEEHGKRDDERGHE